MGKNKVYTEKQNEIMNEGESNYEELKLYSPRVMKEILSKHEFRFSKKLGQNFLIDGNVIRNIVKSAGVDENVGVIEIGPGFGTLTQELCKKAKKVLAIEIDDSLKEVHKDTLPYENLKIIYDDYMNLDVNKLIEEEFGDMKVKLVANLPYYITTPIIMGVLENHINVSSITVMVQKEVGKRLSAAADTKDYGAITLAIDYRADCTLNMIVPKTVFMPKPKVDSAVITIDISDEPKVKVIDEVLMFKIIRAAFNQRRKTILNSLNHNLGIEKELLRELFELNELKENMRAEQLTIEDYARLSNCMSGKNIVIANK